MISREELLILALKSMQFVVVTDADDRIVYVDKEYQKILGVDDSTSLGKHIFEVVPNSVIPHVSATKKADIGSLFTLKNGETVVVNRFPIFQDSEFLGVVTTATFSELGSIQHLQNEIKMLQERNAAYKRRLLELEPDLRLDNLVGETSSMRKVKETIKQFADSDLPILITGETGTGKEVVADAIHAMSRRRNEPFIKINCAAIPKDLLESELFGYSPGAFTGARTEGKVGKFELANHGTILLDEIGEMPMNLQVKLLRVLQEKVIERIGDNHSRRVDVRILCTTNQLLSEAMEKGLFRRDLYYRINAIEIELPPLRLRKDDIGPLVRHFIVISVNKHGLGIDGLREEALDFLNQYDWPGNVRELSHVIERACFVASTGMLEKHHFDFLLPKIAQKKKSTAAEHDLETAVEEMEKARIIKALEECRGNKSAAAKLLRIDRALLYRKISKYKIGVENENV